MTARKHSLLIACFACALVLGFSRPAKAYWGSTYGFYLNDSAELVMDFYTGKDWWDPDWEEWWDDECECYRETFTYVTVWGRLYTPNWQFVGFTWEDAGFIAGAGFIVEEPQITGAWTGLGDHWVSVDYYQDTYWYQGTSHSYIGGTGWGENVPCGHPVSFEETQAWGGDGNIHFNYGWSSSTGHLKDLRFCSMGEDVTYATKPFPSPPFPSNWPTTDNIDHNMWDIRATQGSGSDSHGVPGDGIFHTPYSTSEGIATQNYWYRCGCEGNVKTTMDGPLPIERRVIFENGHWKYSVSKSGTSDSLDLP
jgi:hypothetical protein